MFHLTSFIGFSFFSPFISCFFPFYFCSTFSGFHPLHLPSFFLVLSIQSFFFFTSRFPLLFILISFFHTFCIRSYSLPRVLSNSSSPFTPPPASRDCIEILEHKWRQWYGGSRLNNRRLNRQKGYTETCIPMARLELATLQTKTSSVTIWQLVLPWRASTRTNSRFTIPSAVNSVSMNRTARTAVARKELYSVQGH